MRCAGVFWSGILCVVLAGCGAPAESDAEAVRDESLEAALVGASSGDPDADTSEDPYTDLSAFAFALVAGEPPDSLPNVAPNMQVSLGGFVKMRPDISANLASIQSALKGCQPSTLLDLESNGSRWHEINLSCPGDDKDDSKKLKLSVVVRHGAIQSLTLIVGDPPAQVPEGLDD